MKMFFIWRYSFSTSSGHRSRAIRTLLVVAISLTIVLLVFSIMDALQSSRFDELRRIKSFDITLEGDKRAEVTNLLGNRDVFLYGESEGLIDGKATFIRFIDSNYKGDINILLGDKSGALVSPYLYYPNLDSLNITMMRKGKSGVTLPRTISVPISGVYYTTLGSEFDSLYVFLPIEEMDESVNLKTAIIGTNNDDVNILKQNGLAFTTWKENEKSLYSAFVLEKIMMVIVLSLLFVIIAVSMHQSVRIFWISKSKERAELEVLGMKKRDILFIFMFSFLFIVIVGILIGLMLSTMLLPLVSKISKSNYFITVELKLPIIGIVITTLFLFISIFFFSLLEGRKQKDVMEVIHGK